MRHTGKLVTLLVLLAFTVILFAGCSANEMALFNAFQKSNTIRSMESKTLITLTLDPSELPDELRKELQPVQPLLSGLKLTLDQRYSGNEDGTLAKARIDAGINISGMAMDFGIWVDSDITGTQPKVKEIIKLPLLAAMSMPSEFAGKEYIVLDLGEMPDTYSLSSALDFNKISSLGRKMEAEFGDYLKEYALRFNPGFGFVTSKGTVTVSGQTVKQYQLKLDDSTFKALLKQAANDFLKDEKGIELIKEYLFSVIDIAASSETEAAASRLEMEKDFLEFNTGLPQFTQEMNKVFDAFKDARLIGDNGITVNYSIDKDGFIVNQSGLIDLNIDINAVYTALTGLTDNGKYSHYSAESAPTGKIKLQVEFNTDISSINKEVPIEFPQLTSENSLNYDDILKAQKRKLDELKERQDSYYSEHPRVRINNRPMFLSSAPRLEDGHLIVPARDIFEALGAEVVWNGEAGTVTAANGTAIIVMNLDTNSAVVNGQTQTLPVPIKIIDGKTYAPLRFISESMGARVEWDAQTNTAIVIVE